MPARTPAPDHDKRWPQDVPQMRGLRKLANEKKWADPNIDPALYLENKIQRDWPAGAERMHLKEITRADLSSTFVDKLIADGRKRMEEFIAAEKTPHGSRGLREEVKVLKGRLKTTTDYYWRGSPMLGQNRIEPYEFQGRPLVDILRTAVKEHLLVVCQIEVDPYDHIWIDAKPGSPIGSHAQKTAQVIEIGGRIFLE